jgi:hypothetical protein
MPAVLFLLLLSASFVPAQTASSAAERTQSAAKDSGKQAVQDASKELNKPTVTGSAEVPGKPEVKVTRPTVTEPSVPKVKKPRFGRRAKLLTPEAAQAKALQIPAGAPIALKTADGRKLKGAFEGMSADGISVRSFENGRAVTQTIPYNQVGSLKQKGRPKRGRGPQSPQMLNASIDGLPAGAPVTVTLADKSQVSGRFAGKTPDGISVAAPGAPNRTIPLDQIAGIQQPKGNLPGMPRLQSPTMVKKALSLPSGSPVNLNMMGGGQLSGKLMETHADGFTLQTLEGGNLVNKRVSFDQVASVQPPKVSLARRLPGLKPPGLQTPAMLRTKALGLPAGSPLTVTMPDGSQTVGKLVGTTNDGIEVQSMQGGNLTTQTLSFDQIGSIKPGVPQTPAATAKRFSRTAVMTLVTAAVAGFISGQLAR